MVSDRFGRCLPQQARQVGIWDSFAAGIVRGLGLGRARETSCHVSCVRFVVYQCVSYGMINDVLFFPIAPLSGHMEGAAAIKPRARVSVKAKVRLSVNPLCLLPFVLSPFSLVLARRDDDAAHMPPFYPYPFYGLHVLFCVVGWVRVCWCSVGGSG